MHTATVQEVQASLPVLISRLRPGEELVITQADRPVARLIPEPSGVTGPRRPGSAKGRLFIVAEDDEHLRDFGEYVP